MLAHGDFFFDGIAVETADITVADLAGIVFFVAGQGDAQGDENDPRKDELAAIKDIAARKARYDQLVAEAYDWARALNAGTVASVDDVIDPADTRAVLTRVLARPLAEFSR